MCLEVYRQNPSSTPKYTVKLRVLLPKHSILQKIYPLSDGRDIQEKQGQCSRQDMTVFCVITEQKQKGFFEVGGSNDHNTDPYQEASKRTTGRRGTLEENIKDEEINSPGVHC